MSEIVDAGAPGGMCAYTEPRPPLFDGFVCEREAGHYPATPHAAFLDYHSRPPVFWTDEGWKIDALGRTVKSKPKPPLVRADVEAKQAHNDGILQQLAARGVGVAMGDLLTTYVTLIVERLFGDMDDQRRLELENAYADEARRRLEATASAAMQEFIRQGVTPSGLHLPNGGPS